MDRNIPNAVMLLLYFCMIILATSCTKQDLFEDIDEQPRPRPVPVVNHFNPPVQDV